MEKEGRGSVEDRRSGEERRKDSNLAFAGSEGRSGKERRGKAKRAFFIRCSNCLIVNRVPEDKLMHKPACGNCKTVLTVPQEPVWAKAEAFDRAIAYWPETLLVVFTDPVCLFCKIIDPMLHDLARDKAGGLKIMKVDIESEEILAQRFKIEKTPTFIVYKNGLEVLRVDGSPKEKTDIVKWINNLDSYTSY
jgi:thioredoxin 2